MTAVYNNNVTFVRTVLTSLYSLPFLSKRLGNTDYGIDCGNNTISLTNSSIYRNGRVENYDYNCHEGCDVEGALCNCQGEIRDACNQCGNNNKLLLLLSYLKDGNSACVGCDDIAFSPLRNDSCGVCGGNNACLTSTISGTGSTITTTDTATTGNNLVDPPDMSSKSNTMYILIGAVGGGGLLIIIAIIVIVVLLKKRKSSSYSYKNDDVPMQPVQDRTRFYIIFQRN